jgi:anti-anti-sigma factor
MNFKVEQQEQYAVISLKETDALTVDNAPDFETIVRNLFRKGYYNMVANFSDMEEMDGHGVSAIRKATKICQGEGGIFIVVSKNGDIIDRLDAAKIAELTIMPTQAEAVDAVFLNELENGFEDGRDEEDGDEFGFNEFSEGERDSNDDY